MYILVSLIWVVMFYYYWSSFFFLLIVMEGVMLMFLNFFVFYTNMMGYSFEFVSFFLSMMVIEGSFGLALLIFLTFSGGGDKFVELFFF